MLSRAAVSRAGRRRRTRCRRRRPGSVAPGPLGLITLQIVIDSVLGAVRLELGEELRADFVGDAAGHGEDDDPARVVGFGQPDVALHRRGVALAAADDEERPLGPGPDGAFGAQAGARTRAIKARSRLGKRNVRRFDMISSVTYRVSSRGEETNLNRGRNGKTPPDMRHRPFRRQSGTQQRRDFRMLCQGQRLARLDPNGLH